VKGRSERWTMKQGPWRTHTRGKDKEQKNGEDKIEKSWCWGDTTERKVKKKGVKNSGKGA